MVYPLFLKKVSVTHLYLKNLENCSHRPNFINSFLDIVILDIPLFLDISFTASRFIFIKKCLQLSFLENRQLIWYKFIYCYFWFFSLMHHFQTILVPSLYLIRKVIVTLFDLITYLLPKQKKTSSLDTYSCWSAVEFHYSHAALGLLQVKYIGSLLNIFQYHIFQVTNLPPSIFNKVEFQWVI